MKKEIFINESMGETRIAIQEDSQLVEVYVEKQDKHRMVGNVYKGKVEKKHFAPVLAMRARIHECGKMLCTWYALNN